MTADRILETGIRHTLRAAAVLWVALFAACVVILAAQTPRDAAVTKFRIDYFHCEEGWQRMGFWQRARYWWHDPCKTQVRNVARETGVPSSTLTGK